jgi:flavorubredoxin
MKELLNAVKITEKVYWVGAIDWNIKNFHGYSTEHGTTYNAYLILDKKITLIDTVKREFKDEMLARICSVIDPENIDYIVSNHAEMDHSGSLPDIIAVVKPEKVFVSSNGEKNLKAHFGDDLKLNVVKNGESISIGENTISFIETRMLHWPDSMFSYLSEEKILFSQDGFGMHLAGSQIFADSYPEYLLEWESTKYFANILMLYSDKILALVSSLSSLNLDIKFIAPDHGPVWRKNVNWIIEKYLKWAKQQPEKFAIVIYDTMWQSTAAMARAVADGIISTGVPTEVISTESKDRSYIATLALRAGAIAVGSPTLNNNLLPSIADVLTYLKGLRPCNKIGMAFGSYGWSGESVKQINEYLTATNIALVNDGIRTKFVPNSAMLEECTLAGKLIGTRLIEKIASLQDNPEK